MGAEESKPSQSKHKQPSPPLPPLLSQPWRKPNTNVPQSLAYFRSYKPRKEEVKHLRIMLYGPVGAGKFSFVNSVDSALRGCELKQMQSLGAATLRKIEKDDKNYYPFVFNDIMGLEQNANNGVHVDDIKLALKGHVKEGFTFNPFIKMPEDYYYYNSKPSLDDKVHVMVCVIPASSVSLINERILDKFRQVRAAANELGIPQMAILTKADQACPEVKRNINNLHKSKYLKEQVEKFSVTLGLPINCIFLLKNYESEIDTSDEISVPILAALKQMVNYGEDYLNDLKPAKC